MKDGEIARMEKKMKNQNVQLQSDYDLSYQKALKKALNDEGIPAKSINQKKKPQTYNPDDFNYRKPLVNIDFGQKADGFEMENSK